jgi:2',3'-cyclic-nucleotide 2'-phosphodiesterase (5'-nucleotidase family)
MKPRFLYAPLCFLILIACGKHYLKQKQEISHYTLNERAGNKEMETIVAGYKTRLDSETGKVIGHASAMLTRTGDQSTLGNFVCDAIKHKADSLFGAQPCHLVIMNRGGLRADLPAGSITVNTIFELMPFDNELVLLAVKGEKLSGFLPLFEQKKHAFYGGTITLTDGKANRFLINGKPLDPLATYYILTNDFVANGGDNFSFLLEPVARQNSGVKVREAIIDYCRYLNGQQQPVTPYTDERILLSK